MGSHSFVLSFFHSFTVFHVNMNFAWWPHRRGSLIWTMGSVTSIIGNNLRALSLARHATQSNTACLKPLTNHTRLHDMISQSRNIHHDEAGLDGDHSTTYYTWLSHRISAASASWRSDSWWGLPWSVPRGCHPWLSWGRDLWICPSREPCWLADEEARIGNEKAAWINLFRGTWWYIIKSAWIQGCESLAHMRKSWNVATGRHIPPCMYAHIISQVYDFEYGLKNGIQVIIMQVNKVVAYFEHCL